MRARVRLAAVRQRRRLVIRLRLSPGDLERLRFSYSPLAEVAESLYVLHSGHIPTLHRTWFTQTRTQLRALDMSVLRREFPACRCPGTGHVVQRPARHRGVLPS